MAADSNMFYASSPLSSCDFCSTIVSEQNKIIVYKTLIFSFFRRKIQRHFIQSLEQHFSSVTVCKFLSERGSF